MILVHVIKIHIGNVINRLFRELTSFILKEIERGFRNICLQWCTRAFGTSMSIANRTTWGICEKLTRVKSGIFGQSSKFGQRPCFFYFWLIGIKKNRQTKQTVKILMRRLIWIYTVCKCANLPDVRIYPTLPYNINLNESLSCMFQSWFIVYIVFNILQLKALWHIALINLASAV